MIKAYSIRGFGGKAGLTERRVAAPAPRAEKLPHRLLRVLLHCLPLLLLGGGAGSASACSVPVFRYALERWAADDYLAVVFHEGALTPEQSGWVRDLDRNGLAGRISANVTPLAVDLAAAGDPGLVRLWRQQAATTSLPAIMLLQPRGQGVSTPVWSGPLTGDNVNLMLDSPARREIAGRLLKGDSAVWVLLESGDATVDTRAWQALENRMRHLEATLELSELSPTDILGGDPAASEEQLEVAFSTLRISREDPAEAILVRMLLNTEDDLNAAREPIVFPIFGQGRALYALVGQGINDVMIDEAGEFLTGACSCIIKEQNPGSDLLMAVDWAGLVEPLIKSDDELPPLTGIAGFASTGSSSGGLEELLAGAPASVMAAPTGGLAAPDAAAKAHGMMSPLIRGLILVGGLGGVFLIGATWWLLRHRG
jgi:hypothetical protein